MSITTTKDHSIEVYINSSTDKQSSDTTSNFRAIFPQNIPLPGDMTYNLNVISVACPYTMPQFNTDQRSIRFEVDSVPETYQINKAIINSSMDDLCTYLNGLLNPSSTNVSFSVNSSTQRLVMKNESTNKTVSFSVDGDYGNFWLKMGFSQTQLDAGDLTIVNSGGVKYSVEGDYLPVLVPTQRVYITCGNIKNNSFIPSVSTNPPILCTVDLFGGFGSYSLFENDDNKFWVHDLNVSGNLNSLQFGILDDRYKPVELLGGGLLLSLVIKGNKQ